MHTFIAYIDESGDDGFGRYRQVIGAGGASRWLCISAVVIRATNKLETVSWRDEIKSKTGKQTAGRCIHFADFNHSQKRAACQIISGKHLRFMSTIAHKPSLSEIVFSEKNQLYFYIARYLIERLSWFCRDNSPKVREGNGQIKIVFSRRGGMSYEDFKRYLSDLKINAATNSIHWPVIDISSIEATDHSRDAGLQLADCVASSTASAFEPDIFGNTEDQYLLLIQDLIYQRQGNTLSYGLKLLPKFEDIQFGSDQLKTLAKFR